MKKLIVTLLKIGISVGILAYLIHQAAGAEDKAGENIFEKLLGQPKHWGLLALAGIFCASAVLVTMIRWWYLVRALDLPLKFTNALRIGFLGYLFNLAPMGIIGGDFLKAWMLGREHRDYRVKAFASVIVDRMIGLYMIFVVATAAIVLTGFGQISGDDVRRICNLTYGLTAAGAVVVALVLTPGFTDGRGTRALGRLPRIGPAVEHLIDAVRMYRRQPSVLINSAVMSIAVHCLFATGVYFISQGLFGFVADPQSTRHGLSLKTHFVVAPLSAATGAVPLPLGPFEWVLEMLYVSVPEAGVEIMPGQGLIVALGYRLITLLIAAVGIVYYLGSRQEVAQVMHEAEQEQLGDGDGDGDRDGDGDVDQP